MAKRSHVVRLLKNLPEAPWPSDDPMSGAQCARLLGVGRAAVTQACVQGRLRHAKDGRALLIARADLQAYMADIVRRADALGLHVPAAVRRALGQSAQA